MTSADPAATPASASHAAACTSRTVVAFAPGALAVCAIAVAAVFVLQATNQRALYEQHRLAAGTNVLVAMLLPAVLRGVGAPGLRLKRQRFGSRLLVKLAGIFAIVGVVPGLVIYTVSYQFVTRSIESWFDVKVEGALAAGVSLARVTLDTVANDMAQRTLLASVPLVDVPDAAAGVVLERIRDQLGASDLVRWSASGQAVASVGQSRYALQPERPAAAQWRSAREQRIAYVIEGLDDLADPAAAQEARVKTLVHVPSARVGLLQEPRFLQASLSPCRGRWWPTLWLCKRRTAN